MRAIRPLFAVIVLLSAAATATPAAAQMATHDGDWASYRDAYRIMVGFEKYGGPKYLLQSRLQVLPQDRSALGEGVQLTLAGKTTQLHLPLDPLGRTALPLLKAAYDDNATLALDRKGLPFTLRAQVAIAPRADGVYDGAELRGACVQALDFLRHADASQRGRQCAGVRFIFLKKEGGGIRLRREGAAEENLPLLAGGAGTIGEGFPAASYRFGAAGEKVQLVTSSAPLAILPLIE